MTGRGANDLDDIAERLRAERMRLGLTQVEVAALSGKTKGTVLAWENGGSSPSAVTLAALDRAGADVLFIVTGQRRAAPLLQLSTAGVIIRRALDGLVDADRHRVLLSLLAEELRK